MREHDFRRCYWGHNIFIKTTNEPNVMSGLVIVSPKIQEGDTMLWKTEYGHAVGQVTKSKWMGDPDDMYDVEVLIVDRVVE